MFGGMHSFARVPQINISRSVFDRSFTVKDTFDFDYLVPIYVDEVVPGDTFNVQLNTFARLATQKVPIMDNMYIDYFFFYVPNRLVWANWERFLGAKDNPGDSTTYILPSLPFAANKPDVGSIFDKFGLPTNIPGAWTLKNSLPLRAYNLIWNEWFRDQNLQNSVEVAKDDGPDNVAEFNLLKRGRRHDYFSSALPWPQKGAAVTMPLGTTAPVVTTNQVPKFNTTGATNANLVATSSSYSRMYPQGVTSPGESNVTFGSVTGLQADLSAATSATLNQLREAFAIQALLERDARGGTRAVELIKSHFGVTVPDYRVARPEYLGGGSTRINSHPVAVTSNTNTGQLAAFGTASTMGQNIGFSKSFVEHGYVIGLACARGEVTYQQGLNKMWDRSTRYDFFWPEFIGLGEQAIKNKEIYMQGSAADDQVFGYQERYGEYKFKPGEIHGKFRSTYATPLDMWHLGEKFGALPVLNASFIEQHTPIERSIAVTSEPHILFDASINQKCARPLPVYSTPVTLGRF